MVATEAMALGRPVVVTSACGVAGLVAKLNRDRVVPPRDPAALAAALGPLLRDPALAAKEGMAARALVNETCDPARVAAERLELYAELGAFQSKPTSLFSNSV
jgi:glycosyltransferase involved in cell wall biosynthesis